jgi:crotonobetainyl-CoA:carnitine CoA-transferase CaiB-like acyl-CoA transferase
MARFGGGLETPEEHAHFGTIDVLAGFSTALAAAVALVKRARHGGGDGGGDVARSSLAAAGQLIQLPFMVDYEGRAPFDEPSGRHVKGTHALYRCYEAADGWFFLAAKRERLAALSELLQAGDLAALPDDALEAALKEVFVQRDLAYWVAELRTRDIAIQPTDTMARVRESHLTRESEGEPDLSDATFAFVRHDRHSLGRPVDLVAPNAIRPRRARIAVPGPAPKYGAESRAILSELGYSADEIAELISDGAVGESWSEDYLPE